MRKFSVILIPIFLFTSTLQANSNEIPNIAEEIRTQVEEGGGYFVAKKKKSKKKRRSKKRRSKKSARKKIDLLSKAKKLAVDKQYEKSSQLLFSLTRSSRYRKDSSQIKYILGLMLMEMGLYQVASFVFYDVISGEIRSGRTTKYLRQSLGKLSFLSNALDSGCPFEVYHFKD